MQFGLKPTLTITRYLAFAKALLICFALTIPTQAASHELPRCGKSLHLATKGVFDGTIQPEQCPLSFRIVEWLQLQSPIEKLAIPFTKTIDFLKKNPNWPLKDLLQTQAEENLKETDDRQEVRKWFDENPPLTANGAIFYARALIKIGKTNAARKVVQDAWIKFDFEGKALKPFWQEFKEFLTQENHQLRVDRLLIQEKVSTARIMFPWLNEDHRALSDARIALIEQAGDVDTKLAKVPSELTKHPGLIYDRIKWHRRKENNSSMLQLLKENSQPKQDEELWWRERNILIRRLLDDSHYQAAYELAKNHGIEKGESFANGEWLAGWIALRMLKRPGIALVHFQTLYAKVKSPISLSRGAYWAARAAAALGKKEESQTWMSKAKLYPGTYYGQIALRGSVTGATPPLHSKRPNVDRYVRDKFEQREMVQVIRLLTAVNGKHLIEPFGLKLSQEISDPAEQVLLIELAAKECGPYYGVLTAKKLPMKNVPLIEAAFPILPRQYQQYTDKANPALVHAIIRQESRFKQDAISSAGAQGLMQLMPKTALQTAKKTKTRLGSLSDPNVNIPLGCAHLRELLGQFNGSLILAVAAYNAGITAVQSWIQKYGDPRQPGVDLIDWVEKIPYAETRNYVQRVLENYGYYSQRLKT
jgi:soluble lytic murein transglycosylase